MFCDIHLIERISKTKRDTSLKVAIIAPQLVNPNNEFDDIHNEDEEALELASERHRNGDWRLCLLVSLVGF